MDISIWIRFLTLFICLFSVIAKDYYEILGVKRDASDKEIKRRFRQLGMRYKYQK
jgi:preprotein translocase subunit Sec63